MALSVIDLFAGPGGLNEGFSHLRDAHGSRVFRTVLSVECEESAHRTLELRALFRRLVDAGDTRDYYSYVTGDITRESLFALHREAGAEARSEALLATLGKSDRVSHEIEDKIENALRRAHSDECVLIGGPPCQAYSLVGRARRTNDASFEDDSKHLLYREYLRIVRRFRPLAFLMENVPGLLSAQHKGTRMFEAICRDLRDAGYTLHPLNPRESTNDVDDPNRFVVSADRFGVPQARSRVFVLGLRQDLGLPSMELPDCSDPVVTVKDVLNDLPRIRSRLSRETDCGHNWQMAIRELARYQFVGLEEGFYDSLRSRLAAVHPNYPLGQQAMRRTKEGPAKLRNWYVDRDCRWVLNHNSRAHMRADLKRYFFWSQYASYYGQSPKLAGVPFFLRPAHTNVQGNAADLPFADRFRVQLPFAPSSTIVSHIAKDGHYYIHYEPKQCRSLSVREAARLQSFPDNYFFEGAVTDQYRQVGNAVPPYLAMQIATVLQTILAKYRAARDSKGEASNGPTRPECAGCAMAVR